MSYCVKCGNKLRAGAKHCSSCGNAVPRDSAKTPGVQASAPQPAAKATPPRPQPAAGTLVDRFRQRMAILSQPQVLMALAKGLGKSLAMSAAVLIPGLALMNMGYLAPGMLWLFAGSFGMVAWTYQKPWRLGPVSCLLPPLAAAICYWIQLELFASANLSGALVLGAVVLGAAVGWFRGQAHEIFEEKGQLFARRTLAYLVIWAVAYGMTQLMAFTAVNVLAVRAGLVTGAFSTAMLAAVSIIILLKRSRFAASVAAIVLAMVSATLTGLDSAALAQSNSEQDPPKAIEILRDVDPAVRSIGGGQIQLSSSRFSDVSRDKATVSYTASYPGESEHPTIVVTLRRFDSVAAANPASVVRGKLTNVMGVPVVANGFQVSNKPLVIRGVAAAAKENYLISASLRYVIDEDDGFAAAGAAAGVVGSAAAVVAAFHIAFDPEQYKPEEPAVVESPPPFDRGETAESDEETFGEDDDAESETGSSIALNPGDAAGASAAIAAVLIAAGVAASVAQAIAAAIAGAVQASGEAAASEISGAIGTGAAQSTSSGGVAAVAPSPEPPQPPPAAEPEPPPPAAEAPAEEPKPSFVEGVWNRMSGAVSGAWTEAKNLGTDLYNDPWLIPKLPWETVKGSAKEIWETGKWLDDLNTDLHDPRILIETLGGSISDSIKIGERAGEATIDAAKAAKEAWDDPIVQSNAGEIIGDTMVGTWDDIESNVTKGAGWVKDTLSDPDKVIDGIKILTGIENIENSMDPNRSLIERGGNYVFGVLGIYGTATGARAAGQVLKSGATRVMGTVTGGLGDDMVRVAAGAGEEVVGATARTAAAGGGGAGVAGSLDETGRVAAAAAGSLDETGRAAAAAGGSLDETGRAVAGAGGALDETGRAAAGAAGSLDETGRAAAGAGGALDETGRAAGGAVGHADEGGALGAGSALDETGQAAGSTPPHIDPNYDDYLRTRGGKTGSTVSPGAADDYLVVEGAAADTAGYTGATDKHIQMVADQNGVQVMGRPTTARARDLLESGGAVAKGELVKNKTIAPLDALIGADPDNMALVGHFNPHAPPPVGSPIPPQLVDEFGGATVVTKEIREAALARQATRAEEFVNQQRWIAKNKATMRVKDGLVIDVKTGKPITGDADLWDVRGIHGETLPKATVDHVNRQLIGRRTGQFQHPNHMGWDYTKLSRAPQAGGGASKFDISRGIDGKIRGGHGPGPGGEPLSTYVGREATGPGMRPNPVAKVYVGDRTNPLVERNLLRPIADRHGVNIARGPGRLRVTDAGGEALSPEIESLIRGEVSQGRYGPVAQRHGAKIFKEPGEWQIWDRAGGQVGPSTRSRILGELETMSDPAAKLRRVPPGP